MLQVQKIQLQEAVLLHHLSTNIKEENIKNYSTNLVAKYIPLAKERCIELTTQC